MKKYILTGIAIFILVSIYITVDAARIDAGSWTNVDPIHEIGHNMTMKEAVIYNIPHGVVAGLIAAGIILLLVYLGKTAYEEVKKTRTDLSENAPETSAPIERNE